MEKDYLDSNPKSGYLTDIPGLESFPDYTDYLLKGAIVQKVKVMGYMPQKEVSQYPYIGMSEKEYYTFVNHTTKMVIEAIERYKETIF